MRKACLELCLLEMLLRLVKRKRGTNIIKNRRKGLYGRIVESNSHLLQFFPFKMFSMWATSLLFNFSSV